MDEETTAPAPAPETMQYLPHDLVFKMLLLLDAKPLMRFACVCKAWHSTITGDRGFQREHHRLQELHVLMAPRIRSAAGVDAPVSTTTPGLYRWERKIRQGAFAATHVQAMDSFPAVEEAKRHTLAHCHGLVLMPTDGGSVHVLNPATRRVLTLPPSPHGVAPQPTMRFHRACGLGHDPHTDTYKVVRFFYSSIVVLPTGISGHILGLEVFTIGRDQQWRETEVPAPPCPVIQGQTATYFKGSLLWPIDETWHVVDGDMPVRGFLRFNLEDESFSITPAPPGCPDLKDHTSNLVDMHGELCLAHETRPKDGPHGPSLRPYFGSASIWACSDVDQPRWVQRHVIDAPLPIHMIAAFDDGGILFQGRSRTLECFDSRSTQAARRVTSMHELRYHHPDTKKLVEYTKKAVHGYDVIPYVPNLMPI